jgi:Ca2+-binding EF-hand superfamily protein
LAGKLEAVGGEGRVSEGEYLRLLTSFHETGYRRSFLVDVVFDMFDQNGDGSIDPVELAQLLKVRIQGQGP